MMPTKGKSAGKGKAYGKKRAAAKGGNRSATGAKKSARKRSS